jgi:hypothetical protein
MWASVSGFFHCIMVSRFSSVSIRVSTAFLFMAGDIPVDGYARFVYPSLDICVVSTFGL